MTKNYARRREQSLALGPVDLRARLLHRVRQQGPRPLCLPVAVTTLHEAALSAACQQPAIALALEPLWRHACENGRSGAEGTTLHAISEAVQRSGQPQEVSWRYNPELGAGTEDPPPGTLSAYFHCCKLIELPLAHDGIEESIEAALWAGLPVLIVVELTAEFETPSDGEIAVPALAAPLGDYHAVVAVGASTSSAGDERSLLVRNSWGPGWGLGGYARVPYDYLIAFGVQAAIVDPFSLDGYKFSDNSAGGKANELH